MSDLSGEKQKVTGMIYVVKRKIYPFGCDLSVVYLRVFYSFFMLLFFTFQD